VDIDWEYPVSGGLSTNTYRSQDKTNFTLLLQKLREKLDAQGVVDGKKYLLSFAGGSGNTYIANVELNLISSYVDYAILMTYDLHGPWDTYTDFNAALYSPSETSPQYKLSADSCVKSWTAAGFPSFKIVLGVPFYGYIYSGVANVNNGLYKTFTSGTSITYDKIISDYLSNSTFIKYYHSEAKVPYLFNGSVFITYDDPTSVAEKANYIKTNHLAGASVWELSQNKDGTLINSLSQILNNYS
jgi:chitinase